MAVTSTPVSCATLLGTGRPPRIFGVLESRCSKVKQTLATRLIFALGRSASSGLVKTILAGPVAEFWGSPVVTSVTCSEVIAICGSCLNRCGHQPTLHFRLFIHQEPRGSVFDCALSARRIWMSGALFRKSQLGSPASQPRILDLSTWNKGLRSHATTRSARGCYLCLRNSPLPISPVWTKENW